MSATVSRRDFLKTSAAAAGATIIVCSGAGCSAGQAPQAAAKPEVETPAFSFGEENNMNQRILITYATRTGSTVGVASAIGETLAARGFQVDVKPISDNPALDGYQSVIVGSAINGAQWLPEAVQYVQDHQAALQQMPVALFCVHIMNTGSDERSAKNRQAYLNAVRPLANPSEEAYFTGMGMNPDDTAGIVRWVYRTFKIGGEGDCRDWGKIRAWGEQVFA